MLKRPMRTPTQGRVPKLLTLGTSAKVAPYIRVYLQQVYTYLSVSAARRRTGTLYCIHKDSAREREVARSFRGAINQRDLSTGRSRIGARMFVRLERIQLVGWEPHLLYSGSCKSEVVSCTLGGSRFSLAKIIACTMVELKAAIALLHVSTYYGVFQPLKLKHDWKHLDSS